MEAMKEQKKLWPQPIEVIGLTGEFWSGKTLFALTIAPGPDTLVYDCEKSSATYQSLGFDRVDVGREMLRNFADGYKPRDVFEWWLDHVRSIPQGRYRVIVLDPVSEIESGLVEWVRANPTHFGKSAAQYAKAQGLLWGDVKEYWKMILNDLSSRCETFCFTSHMANVWQDNGPTGKRKAKGKETLMELASLYLQMERIKDKAGNFPEKPSAIVLKSRLSSISFDAATGDTKIVPTLPARLPVATPHAIRQYMAAPAGSREAKPEELAPEHIPTEEERNEAKAATLRSELELEQTRLARVEREQLLEEQRRKREADAAKQQKLAEVFTLIRETKQKWHEAMGHLEEQQRSEWSGRLQRFGVMRATDLDEEEAGKLLVTLRQDISERSIENLF